MKKKKKGFTLIELIAVIAIMGILGVMLSQVFESTLNLNTTQSNKLDVQQNASSIQRIMTNDIRRGTEIEIGNNLSRPIPNSYVPIMYIKTISNKEVYYAYNDPGELRQVILNTDGSLRQDTLIGKYLLSQPNGISVVQASGTYDIKLKLIKKNITKELEFNVAPVNFGGDIS